MGAGLGLVQIASSWPDSHRVELKRHWDQTLTQKSVDDPSESNWSYGAHQFADDWPGGVRCSFKSLDRSAKFEACCESNFLNGNFVGS